jgi:hypothetical protein
MNTLKLLSFSPASTIRSGYDRVMDEKGELKNVFIISAYRELSAEIKRNYGPAHGSFASLCKVWERKLKNGFTLPRSVRDTIDGVVLGPKNKFNLRIITTLKCQRIPVYMYKQANQKILVPLQRNETQRVFSLRESFRMSGDRKQLKISLANPPRWRELADNKQWNDLARELHLETTGLLLVKNQFADMELTDIFREHGVSLFYPVRTKYTVTAIKKAWPYE